MLDLLLWDRLLSALGRGTRVVVLGDHRQLESVQPGRVLADMIVAADGGALNTCHVELDRNYRFESHPGISCLAAAIRQYDGDAAIETLTSTEYREELAHYSSGQIDDALDCVWPQIMEVVRAAEPALALAALARVRILCACGGAAMASKASMPGSRRGCVARDDPPANGPMGAPYW